MKRTIVLSLVLASALSANAAQPPAQQPAQPPAGSNWQHVQALPVGTSLYVNAQTRHRACKLKNNDADTLTCTDSGKDFVFQRTEIVTIKIPRRGRSTLIGMAIGAGGGAIIGVSGTNGSADTLGDRGFWAVVLAVPGALIGAIIGVSTDFSRFTVYRAP